MNMHYYGDPMFSSGSTQTGMPNQQMPPGAMNQQMPQGIIGQQPAMEQISGMLPLEQSYIENILRANRGKVGKFYITIPDSVEWRDKIFTGTVEAAGRDHLIIRDPDTGIRHLLRMIYLDYVDFQGPVNYGIGPER